MKRTAGIVAIVLLLAGAGALVWANPWRELRSVFRAGDAADRIIALSGRIEGDDSAIASKATGRILEIRVREGDSVAAGEILAVLDDQQIRARQEQAREAVASADAREKVAREQIAILNEQLRQTELQTEQAQTDAEGRVRQAE